MYVKYAWLPGATSSNILSDLVKIICGAQDTSTFSSSCDTANTIWNANSSASNWTVLDSASSATSQVVQSLNADGVTSKVAKIDLNGTALTVTAYESWNPSTHTGTNQAANGSSVRNMTMNISNLNVAGNMNIFVTPRYLSITGQYGTGTSNLLLSIIEFSRDSGTLGPTYPCHASFSNNAPWQAPLQSVNSSAISLCRYKNPIAAGDLTGTGITSVFGNYLNPLYGSGSNTYAQSNQSLPGCYDYQNNPFLIAMPIILCGVNSSGLGFVHLGKVQGGIKYFPPFMPSAAPGDEIIISGQTYVLFQVVSGNAIGTNGGAIAIPKV